MVSQKPWRIEAVLRLFFAIISSLAFGLLLVGEIGRFHWTEAQEDLAVLAIMMVCFHLASMAWIGIFLRGESMSWRQAFFVSPRWARAVALGAAAGALATPLLLTLEWLSGAVMTALHWTPEAQAVVSQLESPSLSPGGKILYGLAAVIVAPVAEEAIFRGVLYPAIKQRGFPNAALWGTSALFAASHANAETFVPLMALAALHVWLYERCDNLLAPICSHAAFNTVNFAGIIFEGPLKHLLRMQ